MFLPLLLIGAGAGLIAYKLMNKSVASGGGGGTLNGNDWTPPDPPGPSDAAVIATDPRSPPPGAPLGVGVSPCPTNPPVPVGWAYWTNQPMTPSLPAWAVNMRNSYPIGTMIQAYVDGNLVGARVEYHTLQGADRKSVV